MREIISLSSGGLVYRYVYPGRNVYCLLAATDDRGSAWGEIDRDNLLRHTHPQRVRLTWRNGQELEK